MNFDFYCMTSRINPPYFCGLSMLWLRFFCWQNFVFLIPELTANKTAITSHSLLSIPTSGTSRTKPPLGGGGALSPGGPCEKPE